MGLLPLLKRPHYEVVRSLGEEVLSGALGLWLRGGLPFLFLQLFF